MSGFGKGGMKFKPPKLGVVKGLGVGAQVRADVPNFSGSKDTKYIAGFNPRKSHYSSAEGTNPAVPKPPALHSSQAPYKHQAPTGGKFKIEGW